MRHALLYVSKDGSRSGQQVDERERIINAFAKALVKFSGSKLGLSEKDVKKVKDYTTLISLASKKLDLNPDKAYLAYLKDVDIFLKLVISRVKSGEILSDPVIMYLVENLTNSSPTYTLKNGTVTI